MFLILARLMEVNIMILKGMFDLAGTIIFFVRIRMRKQGETPPEVIECLNIFKETEPGLYDRIT